MPWGVRRAGNKYEIYRKDTGEHVGWSTSKKKAEISVGYREKAVKAKGEKV